MTDFNPADFGLPASGDLPADFFNDDSGILEVDENDPIYQQVVEAMKANGMDVPKPDEAPRPPAMNTETGEGTTPPVTPPVTPPAPPAAPSVEPPPSTQLAADTAPLTVGTDQGAGDGAATNPAIDPTIDPALPTSINVTVGEDTYELNQDQVSHLLQINAWLENVPDATKAQWAGIQDGTHVSVTREEYARLTTPNQPSAPATPSAPDLDDLDDETAAYIRHLQGTQQPTVDTPRYDQAPSAADMQAAANAQATRRVQLQQDITATTDTFRTHYELTDEQTNHLQRVTAELRIIPSLTQQGAVYSPTGQLISEPPMADVINRAYEIAMNSDPTLKQIADDRAYNERLARDLAANQRVNEKKGRAGSLASAPSAAVPATGAELPKIGAGNQMDFNATSNAIAAALAEAAKQGV